MQIMNFLALKPGLIFTFVNFRMCRIAHLTKKVVDQGEAAEMERRTMASTWE